MLFEEDSWHCLLCKVKFHQCNFPFTLRDDTEIQNFNNTNSMRFCQLEDLRRYGWV